MLLFKFFLDVFFFFTGSRLQLPATRPSGESHGPTASLGSQRRGALGPPDPRDSRLGTAREPGHPLSAPGAWASLRSAQPQTIPALTFTSQPRRRPCRELAAAAAASPGSWGEPIATVTGRSTPKSTCPGSRGRAGVAQTSSPRSPLTRVGSGAAGMSKPLPAAGARQLPGVFDASRRAQGAARPCLRSNLGF